MKLSSIFYRVNKLAVILHESFDNKIVALDNLVKVRYVGSNGKLIGQDWVEVKASQLKPF